MKYVAYYRVSTKKQDYGIDAQQSAVRHYIYNRGGDLAAEFSEKESGKNAERPELKKAVELSKKEGASLIISKLDRLSREVSFLFNLKAELDRAGVHIVCCDLPDLNTLTLGIFATMAQHERELISKRTKEGLAVAREKGKRIGTPDPVPDYVKELGRKAQTRASIKYYSNVKDIIRELRAGGKTYQSIADLLNRSGFKTREGFAYTAAGVWRVYGEGGRQQLLDDEIVRIVLKMAQQDKTLTETAQFLNLAGFRTSRGKLFRPYTISRIICGIK